MTYYHLQVSTEALKKSVTDGAALSKELEKRATWGSLADDWFRRILINHGPGLVANQKTHFILGFSIGPRREMSGNFNCFN